MMSEEDLLRVARMVEEQDNPRRPSDEMLEAAIDVLRDAVDAAVANRLRDLLGRLLDGLPDGRSEGTSHRRSHDNDDDLWPIIEAVLAGCFSSSVYSDSDDEPNVCRLKLRTVHVVETEIYTPEVLLTDEIRWWIRDNPEIRAEIMAAMDGPAEE